MSRLETARNSQDFAQIADFSRMVNFPARRGSAAQPYAQTPLWQVHLGMLRDMIFAHRAWSDAEDAEYRAARAVLYDTSQGDVFAPLSEAYLLYREYARIYAELQLSEADPMLLNSAMTDWLVHGSKSQIEAAEATIARLASRSTLPLANDDRVRIDSLLPVDPTGLTYAMTSFSPLSASTEAGWLRAEVDLSAIDPVLDHDSAGQRAWRSWLGARRGVVSFRYVMLVLHREWFTDVIYRGEDWTREGGKVSDGSGTHGALAAVPNRLFLVRQVTVKLDRPKPDAQTGPRVSDDAIHAVLHRKLRSGPRAKPSGRLTASARVLSANAGANTGASLRKGVRPGVLAGRAATLGARKRSPQTVVRMLRTLPHHDNGTDGAAMRVVTPSKPVTAKMAFLRSAVIEKLDQGRIYQRLQHAADLISQRNRNATQEVIPNQPPAGTTRHPPPSDTIWVVGFGCDPLPQAPNPNPNYSWPNGVAAQFS
ncbi:hypothetical protein [Phaeobacter sp.]|uniref:hypothetical protein n=1 Tax=Phaeobacter sp. TaxID=1902409 RepID=UPI0025ED15AF|nr:hypothetical protein [Phaeobacter sp.]